jgi:hypothetical protein
MSKRKRKRTTLPRNRFDCIDCGHGVKVDEDGCCGGCGRQTVIVEGGIPDYSGVLAGIEADEAERAERGEGERCGACGGTGEFLPASLLPCPACQPAPPASGAPCREEEP